MSSSRRMFTGTWPKSQIKNLDILRTKMTFKVKWKAFLIICEGLSVAKNCLIPESAPLKGTDAWKIWFIK